MKKNLLVFLLILSFFLLSARLVLAEKSEVYNQIVPQIESKKIDNRAKVLSDYLAKYNSPLQYHAQDFIEAADTYKLDWRLIPAIAGVESTFGKHIPGGFNAWGWGVYGNQAIYFNSWRDGIFTIAKGLREGYLNKGLTDPYTMNKVYAASPFWGSKVAYFLNDLETFASGQSEWVATPIANNPTIAAASGQLALK